MIPFSVLDLAPIAEGNDAGQALRNALDLARHAERLGYRRFWMAEHHSMPGIASAASWAPNRLEPRIHTGTSSPSPGMARTRCPGSGVAK